MKRRAAYAAIFAAVLLGGLFYSTTSIFTDDTGPDW